MKLSSDNQAALAKEIMLIADDAKGDSDILAHVYKIVLIIVKLSKQDDIIIAADLSKYIYELLELSKGNEDMGWKDKFRADLKEDLKLYEAEKDFNYSKKVSVKNSR